MRLDERVPADLEPGAQDAFHVPAILVEAEVFVRPGDDVRFPDNSHTFVRRCSRADRHGVANPFWDGEGPFWVLIDPKFLRGTLRHQFTAEFVSPPKPPEVSDIAKAAGRPEPEEDDAPESTDDGRLIPKGGSSTSPPKAGKLSPEALQALRQLQDGKGYNECATMGEDGGPC